MILRCPLGTIDRIVTLRALGGIGVSQMRMRASRTPSIHAILGLCFAFCTMLHSSSVSEPLSSADIGKSSREKGDIVSGILYVKVKAGVLLSTGALSRTMEGLAGRLSAASVTRVDRAFPHAPLPKVPLDAPGRPDLSRIYRVSIPAPLDPELLARRISRDPSVEYAEPKYLQKIFDVPNDPGVSSQLAVFSRMNVFAGWTVTHGTRLVPIAVVDGGTYWQHEDLLQNIWVNPAEDLNNNGRFDKGPPPAGDEDGIDQDGNGYADDVIGWNFNTGGNDPVSPPLQPDNFAHGTATASHFGAVTNNAVGMAGTGWNCALMPVCAAARSGDNLIGYGYEGIEYAFRNGARVINCSWGRSGSFSHFEQEVIQAATDAGALVVAAAGNDNTDIDYSREYPASYRNVLSVGASSSSSDAKTGFSNYGASVDVFAPGNNIWSAFTNGGYGDGGSGTSYSSPLVAGLAGLVASLHPGWSPDQIGMQIRVTADPVDAIPANAGLEGKLGRGRVNFARALTESWPGLMVVTDSLYTPSGSDLFLQGDTVVLSVSVRNILSTAASNLRFTCAPETADLDVLQGTAAVPNLSSGEMVVLPAFRFRVKALSASSVVVLRLGWSADGGYADAAAFRLLVFPSPPAWLRQDSPALVSLFSVKAVSAATGWAAGGDGQATQPVVIRTADSGKTWQEVTGNLADCDVYCIDAVDDMQAWVGTAAGELFSTANGGTTWTRQSYPAPVSPFMNGVKFINRLTGYAMGDPPAGSSRFVVLKTTDGGTTWAHTPSEPVGIAGEAGWNNSFWWTDAQHGWIGTNSSKVWRTTDGGATWSSGNTGSAWSVGVAFGGADTGIAVHYDGVIARTVDGGATWRRVTSPVSDGLVGVSYAPGAEYAWTGTATELLFSKDNGAVWSMQETFPFEGAISHLSFADTASGWAVTRDGEILRYMRARPYVRPGPVTYELKQNFPNPFNGRTTIEFSLPRRSRVRVEVFTVLGQKVATLVDEERLPSSYRVEFHAGGFASGVYLCRMRVEDLEQGGEGNQVIKLLYLR